MVLCGLLSGVLLLGGVRLVVALALIGLVVFYMV
jgi:hypothetical protein